ncbi:PEP-CTERM sorting domain-containing protein [Massilia sp. S19_KUP03_FR1]|uniref:PEP-CTERM sorting domain-containing protein n=1 Tax=Massilia sp. S19_KUP03_FR1 TaxID=3025503 RepID=UPI002FCDC299
MRRTLAAMTLLAVSLSASATSILFVGNSYTYGDPAGAPPLVKSYRPDTVTDLNGSGIGGVPALFKAMTVTAGLQYDVSLETVAGAGLDQHYRDKFSTIVKPFDVVLLQSYSTLDANKPGDPATLVKYAGMLAEAFHRANPNVVVRLTATWSRADQAYTKQGPWYGKPIGQMALDVRRGYNAAKAASPLIRSVIPVGEAWNRAFAAALADVNPYDGITYGQVNLWAPDGHHASVYGYYLEALTIFGNVTGRDPRSLGAREGIAKDLGIDVATAGALQDVAAQQLATEKSGAPE